MEFIYNSYKNFILSARAINSYSVKRANYNIALLSVQQTMKSFNQFFIISFSILSQRFFLISKTPTEQY